MAALRAYSTKLWLVIHVAPVSALRGELVIDFALEISMPIVILG